MRTAADKYFFPAGSCPHGSACTGFLPAPWEAGRQGDGKPPGFTAPAPGTRHQSSPPLGGQGCPRRAGDTPSVDRGVAGCSPCTCCSSFPERVLGTACEGDPGISARFSSLPLQSWGPALLSHGSAAHQSSCLLGIPSQAPGRVLLSACPGSPCCRCSCHRTRGRSPVTRGQLRGCLCSACGCRGGAGRGRLTQGCWGHRGLPSSLRAAQGWPVPAPACPRAQKQLNVLKNSGRSFPSPAAPSIPAETVVQPNRHLLFQILSLAIIPFHKELWVSEEVSL